MNKRLLKSLLVGGSALMLLLFMTTAHTAADNPHLISKQVNQASCTGCHNSTPELKDDNILISKNLRVDPNAFVLDGVAMCTSCHNANEGHKVDLNIDFPIPADMPLGQDNDITCLTCHYTHGKLDSDHPQASFSFMDRLLNAERLRKSFLLRRNNSDGDLCLTCHNPNQGQK